MRKCGIDRAKWESWALRRLRRLPLELFHGAVLHTALGYGATQVARWLFSFPNRGELTSAKLETIHRYLKPLYKHLLTDSNEMFTAAMDWRQAHMDDKTTSLLISVLDFGDPRRKNATRAA